ncbi:diguanylate cyclase [Sulfurimonas sp.]|uniref:GGDEF domain-containing protein n=1 Tax=Sulfurimonas sp. TaxID=2022749 RepID=UPI0025ED1C88|nr:diguanylate cyclase [Sulfurimonas sp.]MBW6488447.1 diguanylate cyclase [Sulfurimonas sp.]
MKKDWSAIRITLLLYLIVLLIPINYYFVKGSFNGIKNDAATMHSLVLLSGAIQALSVEDELHKKEILAKSIDSSLGAIEQNFINFSPNKEYVELFRAKEMFSLLKNAYEKLENSTQNSTKIRDAADKVSMEINAFSKLVEEMTSYKIETALNKLYVSLAFTTLLVIILIFFVRTYIKLQFSKHTLYDHVTGLYNKKYFESVLQNSKELAIRHNKPLSLLLLSINNYDEQKSSLNRTDFEKHIKEVGTIFSNFFRRSDTICRIENNCFASIVPNASPSNIKKISFILEKDLESKLSKSKIKLQLSIGMASCEEDNQCSILEEAIKDMEKFSIIRVGSAL